MKNWLTTSKYLTTLYLLLIAEVTFSQQGEQFAEQLSNAAIELTKVNVSYDATYRTISYPNGDVPPDKGVCTDLVIRAYRKLGIDLQKEVHEDMQKNFNLYPKIWGLTKPDKNIDHRRVPNLMVYFERFGEELTITSNPTDYKPGEIVTWDLGGGVPHIGIVINKKSSDGLRYLIVHNIGNGQEISDCLFTYKVTGHYQYPKH
ncbi:MAG TPA: DUF1287 domain-containing protein [Tenuifilaceae bacterium]|nr:DUF1287 domain-containing protein [Tenuifilaceae bacterium]